MKIMYKLLLPLLLVAALVMMPDTSSAQDTLVVQWETEPGNFTPNPNALRDAILSDTLRPDGRVYKLLRGGFYQLTDAIEHSFHLRLVGEPGGETVFDNPPAIQMVLRDDGSGPSGRILTSTGSLTLKNLWITGADNDGTQTYYEPVTINASNSVIEVDNVVFDRSNFAMLSFYGTGNEIYIRNSHFRNLTGNPSTQQWEGRAISIWADQNKAIIENNTFFNIGFTAFQMEGGSVDYVSFVHNTLVNVGRSINAGNWWNEAYFANNLIINGFWHGEGADDLAGESRDERLRNSGGGMFSIGDLPFIYGPNEGRRILFTHTASWRDPDFENHYADSIATQPFIAVTTREDFIDAYDNMVVRDTTWLGTRPDFATFPEEGLVQEMIANITDLRSGITPANPYFWNRVPDFGTGPCEECVFWPIPEDFAYTDANLLTASTNGLPLGDLNWFPASKADWNTNRDQYMTAVEELAGPVIELTPEFTVEAENGTVSGDAVVDSFDGFAYFQMDGGGWFEWTFEIPEAGQYDLNVWTHMRNNGQRGQRLILNGVSLKDPKGWGEYIWDTNEGVHAGMVIDDWTWTLITNENMHPEQSPDGLVLPAGTNTLRVESSWGFQNFAGFDFIPAGGTEPSVELRPPTATSSIVAEVCGDADYCPSGFQKVLLGSDSGTGSITWNFNLDQAGTFFMIAFYQAPFGPQSGEFVVNTMDAMAMTFDGVEGDESGLSTSSEMFELSAGAHSMTLSNTGGQFNVDFVQLIRVGTITSIPVTETPQGFALSQNYPNPFNPTTAINFTIPDAQDVRLTVYNVLGQRVAVLADGFHNAGQHIVSFDARRLASGVYIYRIETGDFVTSRKMMLIK